LQPFAAQGLQPFLALHGLQLASCTGVSRLAAAAGRATLDAANAATLKATAVFLNMKFSCLHFTGDRFFRTAPDFTVLLDFYRPTLASNVPHFVLNFP
jgi:hypothetical protein